MKKKKLIGRSIFIVAAILAVPAFIAGPVSSGVMISASPTSAPIPTA